MVRSGIGLFAVVGVLAVALAGCAPAVHHPAPHHSHVAGATEAPPSPTPTPVATKPALADLVLSADGLGDIPINAPVPSSTLIASVDPTACVSADVGIAAGDPDAAAWVANYPVPDPSNPTLAEFIIQNVNEIATGPVQVIWVWGPGIHTAGGIEVGSTKAQVQAAYPHPDSLLHGAISDVYILNGSVGKLAIEVARADSGDVGYWGADQANKVLWMGAVAPGRPISPIAATDGGPSNCPHGNTG